MAHYGESKDMSHYMKNGGGYRNLRPDMKYGKKYDKKKMEK